MALEWIDVSDRLPPFDVVVMVKGNGHECRGHYSNTYLRRRFYWCVYTPNILNSQVTHWREI